MSEQGGPAGQPVPVTPFDTGNQLLQAGACQLSVTPQDTPGGQLLLLTIRTSSATLTVVLTRDEALEWARSITTRANGLSRLITPGAVPPGLARPANGRLGGLS